MAPDSWRAPENEYGLALASVVARCSRSRTDERADALAPVRSSGKHE